MMVVMMMMKTYDDVEQESDLHVRVYAGYCTLMPADRCIAHK